MNNKNNTAKNTTSSNPQTNSPQLFIDVGSKRTFITDEQLALFSEDHHKEALKVLLVVVDNWAYRAVNETKEKESSVFRELTIALIQDLNDYISQGCLVLATYPPRKQSDNVEIATGGAA